MSEPRKRSPAFDHARVADGLARASGKDVSPDSLPFGTFDFTSDGRNDRFHRLRRDLALLARRTELAHPHAGLRFPTNHAVAPDGRKAVFRRDRNLWIKDSRWRRTGADAATASSSTNMAMSRATPSFTSRVENMPGGMPPSVSWSPDSTKFLTHRIDETKVGEMSLWQGAPDGSRPCRRSLIFRQSQPGDAEAPEHDLHDLRRRAAESAST